MEIKSAEEKKIVSIISNEVARGRKNFILYPFGEMGKLTKKILNDYFKISEYLIIDNGIAREKEVFPLKYLNSIDLSDKYILITSSNESIYSEIRKNICKYVPQEQIIDLFENRYITFGRDYCIHMTEISNFSLDNIITLNRYNVKFYLPFWKTDLIQREILFNDRYFDDFDLYYVTKVFMGGINLENGVVLDIGANIGNHSIYFAKECYAKKVISFEPVLETFNILKKNIEINGLDDVIYPYNWGIGEKKSRAVVNEYNLTNIGATRLTEKSEGDIEIFSIDDIDFQDNIVLIKIDVEGDEEKVIKGALKTIKRNSPMIMLEAWDINGTIYNIINMLALLGYDFRQLNDCDYLFYVRH